MLQQENTFIVLQDRLLRHEQEVTELFQRCLDWDGSLIPGEISTLDELQNSTTGLKQAGWIILWEQQEPAVWLIFPTHKQLPEWIRESDSEQQDQIQELLTELTTILFGGSETANTPRQFWTQDIENELNQLTASPDSLQLFSISVQLEEVETPPIVYFAAHSSIGEDSSAEADESENEAADEFDRISGLAQESAEGVSLQARIMQRVKLITQLEVKLTVSLAEKQTSMKQLVNLTPGSLIMFQKSCDDLLDVYVNNQLYAQGEAVKIGEKFGIKINEVGVVPRRPPGVFKL